MEKRKSLYTMGRCVSWFICYVKQYGGSWKKLKIELPCDPAILCLGIYLKETKTLICKDTCTQCHSRFDPCVRTIPWSRKWQPTPVILPGKSHGQRSPVGCHPWGRRESDTDWAHTHTMLIAALFTVARLWKPTMCPSIDKQIKKLWCSYTLEYSSAMKKN